MDAGTPRVEARATGKAAPVPAPSTLPVLSAHLGLTLHSHTMVHSVTAHGCPHGCRSSRSPSGIINSPLFIGVFSSAYKHIPIKKKKNLRKRKLSRTFPFPCFRLERTFGKLLSILAISSLLSPVLSLFLIF